MFGWRNNNNNVPVSHLLDNCTTEHFIWVSQYIRAVVLHFGPGVPLGMLFFVPINSLFIKVVENVRRLQNVVLKHRCVKSNGSVVAL